MYRINLMRVYVSLKTTFHGTFLHIIPWKPRRTVLTHNFFPPIFRVVTNNCLPNQWWAYEKHTSLPPPPWPLNFVKHQWKPSSSKLHRHPQPLPSWPLNFLEHQWKLSDSSLHQPPLPLPLSLWNTNENCPIPASTDLSPPPPHPWPLNSVKHNCKLSNFRPLPLDLQTLLNTTENCSPPNCTHLPHTSNMTFDLCWTPVKTLSSPNRRPAQQKTSAERPLPNQDHCLKPCSFNFHVNKP